jgi:glycosyltransferase involved in cell wall biosynthesis
VRRIALLDPVSDAGIGAYSHELANALTRAGTRVDLYSKRISYAAQFPRTYRHLPVLGRPLSAQRDRLQVLWRGRTDAPAGRWRAPARWGTADPYWREHVMSVELASFLSRRRYDAVWTQWPSLGTQEGVFRSACRGLGLPVIHTVHNVLPHEHNASDSDRYRQVYDDADVLIVHSDQARRDLLALLPSAGPRTVVAAHGLYTMYPRQQAARLPTRARLGASAHEQVILIFGGIRPYKNVDAAIDAFARANLPNQRLVICGWEWGYDDMSLSDSLAHTRRKVEASPAARRISLVPGPVDAMTAMELFEAADAVLLPYGESWGSGVLLMAMSYGRGVIVSAAGGMPDYVTDYAMHVVLSDTSSHAIAEGLIAAARHGPLRREAQRPPALEWDAIVPPLLSTTARILRKSAAHPDAVDRPVPAHPAGR